MSRRHMNHIDDGQRRATSRDDGFTLVEILIAIVLVGILSAVVVVGISALTDKGSSAACTTSLDAAKAGTVVYYTTNAAYPTTLQQMTGANPPDLTLSSGITLNPAGTAAIGSGWTLTMTPGVAAAAPTFSCANTSSSSSGAANGTAACPGTFVGWVGEYYSNSTLSGTAALCRDDPAVNFAWGGGGPATGLPVDQFSSRWTRSVAFTAGSHTFTIGSDDGSRLYIDGVLVLDYWNDHAYGTQNVTKTLTAGNHTVVMEFYEAYGQAQATLNWT